VDWVKAITELIKASAHFAWPALVGLIVWWFRKEIRTEIADLIARISKFKAFGVEAEINKKEVDLALQNVRAEFSEEKIQEVKDRIKPTLLLESQPMSVSSASAKVKTIEGLDLLMERAWLDPRAAIKRSWELLAKTVFQAANVQSENLEPYSEDMLNALKRLEKDSKFSLAAIRTIENLQMIARKVFFQSQYAYAPSANEAQDFILYSAITRGDLGEKLVK
jgi:hypothetical protein